MTVAPVEADEQFMRRAIRLAMNGRGRVEPNPMVGCVIVKAGHVIGGGYHRRYGEAHAEPNALESCIESPEGATAYVTLEPCCHLNKKTPPCVPRLIEARLARVVVGSVDPNPDVNGKGIAALRNAGITVDDSTLRPACDQLLAPFVARTLHRQPYVTLKWAQTADGKVAGPGGRRLQISNARSAQAVQDLRARCEAIAVGINTVLADDPLLTARSPSAPHNAQRMRIVFDASLRIDPTRRLFEPGDAATPVRIYHGTGGLADRIRELAMTDAELRPIETDASGRVPLRAVLDDLYADRVTHLLVEPGPTLAQGFLDAGLADRVWIFRAPARVDDPTAPAAASLPRHFIESGSIKLDDNTLTEYLNSTGNAFAAPEPSADLVLTGPS